MADRDLSKYRIMASYVLDIYIYIYIYLYSDIIWGGAPVTSLS